MVDQYYFETTETERRNHPGRVRARLARFQVQSELRRQREFETNRVTAQRIESTIAELERKITSLDDSIDAVLAGAKSRDPSNIAYPIAATALNARRDNMRNTIAILSGWLATVTVT